MTNGAMARLAVCSCFVLGVQVAICDVDQRGMLPKIPTEVKLMITSFGSIDSQSEVEGWLSDLLRPQHSVVKPPEPAKGDMLIDPSIAAEAISINWNERKLSYWRESEAARKENERKEKILMNLKTAALSDASQRYTILGRDYLQSALAKQKVGRLIKIIDRGNMTIQQTEKSIVGKSTDLSNGADCVLSVVLGDREESSKTIPIDNVGTKVVRKKISQPYVGKVRDLDGNVLISFDGVVNINASSDNVVNSSNCDPARELIAKVCEKIASEIAGYFTAEVKFKIKVPEGFDADDVEISVDGKTINGTSVRLLALEHVVSAELDGCNSLERVIQMEPGDEPTTVRLNFKKAVN